MEQTEVINDSVGLDNEDVCNQDKSNDKFSIKCDNETAANIESEIQVNQQCCRNSQRKQNLLAAYEIKFVVLKRHKIQQFKQLRHVKYSRTNTERLIS